MSFRITEHIAYSYKNGLEPIMFVFFRSCLVIVDNQYWIVFSEDMLNKILTIIQNTTNVLNSFYESFRRFENCMKIIIGHQFCFATLKNQFVNSSFFQIVLQFIYSFLSFRDTIRR